MPLSHRIPASLRRLEEVAYNLWWSWNPEGIELFHRLDPELWAQVGHSPVRLLQRIDPGKLREAARSPSYQQLYRRVLAAFDAYMEAEETWFSKTFPDLRDATLAYFSAEFGIHECLPIYSGGLGVLAGDHIKTASDLGVPLVAVGFLYPQGYFTQRINADGHQEAIYEKLNMGEVPVRPAVADDGKPVEVCVELPGREIYARVWQIQVGRVPLFLLDTDLDRNAPEDRVLAARLYQGDWEMRISQELVLGIGGVRALRALGYDPVVFHMNEGHSAFLGLERLRELVEEEGLSFEEALAYVRATTLFTTHTPVPAGHDTFSFEMIGRYLKDWWTRLGISWERFLDLGRQGDVFSMTVLALRCAGRANGVSELHGHVSRRMWAWLWPGLPVEEVPIGHITNGVHTNSWLALEMGALFDQYLPLGWRERPDDPAVWEKVEEIPDEELWATHRRLKARLLKRVAQRTAARARRLGEPPVGNGLNLEALTIGFARRMVRYKRATLFFRDRTRARQILHDPERPVQLIYAGKAHPQDEGGKALLRELYQLTQEPDFRDHARLVEEYDIALARHLVAGSDVWLNNPRRPLEASGTSGQKAALNGVPNLSVLDGWWREGYDGENGWAIGEEREYPNEAAQDDADAASLYRVLTEEVLPAYFERDATGVPRRWVKIMKRAIRTCAPRFSAHRMLKEYVQRYYAPCARQGIAFAREGYARARELAAWLRQVRAAWPQVAFEQVTVGEDRTLQVRLSAPGLTAEDLAVEAVVGRGEGDAFEPELRIPLAWDAAQGVWWARLPSLEREGGRVVRVRALAFHPDLPVRFEPGLLAWAPTVLKVDALEEVAP